MHRRTIVATATIAVACFAPFVARAQGAPKVVAATPEAAGEYLMIVGSCHDCHTPNWTESKGKTSKDSLLTGRSIGLKGAWGTTFSKNLRTIAARQSEDHWVNVLKTTDDGEGLMPMPWHNTSHLSEEDMRALYKYTKSLGTATGERIPRNVKAGAEPTVPYVDLTPKAPKTP